MIRAQPCYRREAFDAGLEAAGYAVHDHIKDPTPGDVLVIWNRYGRFDQAAHQFERVGAKVLVVENGYIGQDRLGRQYYAIALTHHNGPGGYRFNGKPRCTIGGISLEPWRDGEEIVILAQRGIGERGIAQPHGWLVGTERRLRDCGYPVRVRAHPGTRDATPLLDDLRDAHCAITWASGAAIKALCFGVPVFYGLKGWIGRDAASKFAGQVSDPRREGREAMLARISWAQWTVDEIARGHPFSLLCAS